MARSSTRKTNIAAQQASEADVAKLELANRLFFRLYQCANMLHKTGSRAVEAEGLTTQQWAVLGALSRERAADGVSVGDLARYLMVSRQNLSGVIGRMERDGHVAMAVDGRDRRSRLITMTATGRRVWTTQAQPKIRDYYREVLGDFSINDATHTLHYLLKMLENMKRVDARQSGGREGEAPLADGDAANDGPAKERLASDGPRNGGLSNGSASNGSASTGGTASVDAGGPPRVNRSSRRRP
jgi:DNA-binding MarR family transcriptional regulator